MQEALLLIIFCWNNNACKWRQLKRWIFCTNFIYFCRWVGIKSNIKWAPENHDWIFERVAWPCSWLTLLPDSALRPHREEIGLPVKQEFQDWKEGLWVNFVFKIAVCFSFSLFQGQCNFCPSSLGFPAVIPCSFHPFGRECHLGAQGLTAEYQQWHFQGCLQAFFLYRENKEQQNLGAVAPC